MDAIHLYGYSAETFILGIPFAWIGTCAHLLLMMTALWQDESGDVIPRFHYLKGRVLEFVLISVGIRVLVVGVTFWFPLLATIFWIPLSYFLLFMFAGSQSALQSLGSTLSLLRHRWFLMLWLGLFSIAGSLSGSLICCIGLIATFPLFAIVSALQWKVFQGLPLGQER